MRREDDVVDAELGARDLNDNVRNSLAHLGGRAVDRGTAIGMELDSRRGVVVVTLRVTDVLEADREANTALDPFAARRVARTSGKTHRIARELLGIGDVERGCPANHVRDRK